MAKGKHQWDVHHRKPRSQCKTTQEAEADGNTIKVRRSKHSAFHHLFANQANMTMTANEIAAELNKTWIPLDKRMVCMDLKEYEEYLLWMAKEEMFK